MSTKTTAMSSPTTMGTGSRPYRWCFTHVVLALGDQLYQRCRAQESRRELWNALRVLVNAFLVEGWRHLLEVYLEEADASP